jgi:protein CpxP
MKLNTRPAKVFVSTLAVALAGAFAVGVSAAPGAGPGGGPGAGPMMGQGAMMGGHYGMGGPFGMGGMLQGMLDRVNATPEQRTQIKQIMDKMAGDMTAQREAGRALRTEAMTLFAQPTVDAKAVEALRVRQMAQHDEVSKRVTQAMLEASRVLTPEQRKQIADTMNQRREMMQRHQHERQSLDAPKS